MWTALTSEGVEVFELAVYHCLQRWRVLQDSVQREFGGPTSAAKFQRLLSDVVAFFTCSKQQRYFDELENLLEQRMLEFFYIMTDDKSGDVFFKVTELLMTMHEQCMLGNYENVRRMFTPAPAGTGQSTELSNLDDSDNVEEDHQLLDDMQVEYPVAANGTTENNQAAILTQEEVADGWQAVPLRRGRRRTTGTL